MSTKLHIPLSDEEEGLLRPSLDKLTKTQIIGYAVGHFQNDLCAACWFNYLLYFMKNVIFKDNPASGFYAGLVFLSGQIADALATPLAGYYSDRTNTSIGKRTPWYIGGTIAVTICFFFIFQDCILCSWFHSYSDGLMILYYCLFPAAFNVGWASVQVAHMSLVPSLTLSRKRRDLLVNMRNTFTYTANLFVLIFAFLMFLLLKSGFMQFRVLALVSLGLGCITSLFFLITVREKQLTDECNQLGKQLQETKASYFLGSRSPVVVSPGVIRTPQFDRSFQNLEGNPSMERSPTSMKSIKISPTRDEPLPAPIREEEEEEAVDWKYWFKLTEFYIYGFVYMGCRILVNVQSSLIIFYLQNVLGFAKGINSYEQGLPIEFAIIPMLIYLSSTITSGGLEFIFLRVGRKKAFSIGAVAALLGAFSLLILNEQTRGWMYPLALLIGFGQSICLNTAIALITEVVGLKGSYGAFVFGAYSFLDKFSNGVLLYAMVNLEDISNPANQFYIKICVSVVPAVATLVAWILVSIGKAADYDAGDVVTDVKAVQE